MHATDFRGGQLFPGGSFLYSLCAFVCRFLLFAFTFTPRRVVFCFFVVAVVASFHFSIPTKQNRPQPEAILLSLSSFSKLPSAAVASGWWLKTARG